MGIAPHVLHHVGPLVGTALVAGSGGTALFGALGLAASIPMLVRVYRRFSSWWAPAIALLVFVVSFVISTVVVGPLISGRDGSVTPGVSDIDHGTHHP